MFRYVPRPSVSSLKPTEGPSAGGTSVTIAGGNFTGATAVYFGATKASSFTLKSASSILAKSPPGTQAADVTVMTPGGTSATSAADRFHYVPSVSKVSPTTGPTQGGTTVTITGVGLAQATAVRFGSVAASSFVLSSATTITAVTPEAAAGAVDVRVITPEGASPISGKDKFKFAPTITGLDPSTGSTAGGTTVTVTGAGFVPGTSATTFKFGSTAGVSVNCPWTTECTVISPSHAAGRVEVRATVKSVASPKASAGLYTYL